MVCSSKVTSIVMSCKRELTINSRRPYLHMYTHSNELEEVGIISLDGVNVESDPQKELLLGVRNHHFQNSPAPSHYFHYSNAFLSLFLHPRIRML